jgi:hypothetical protein
MGDFWEWVSDTAGAAVGTVIDFFKTDDGNVDWAKIAPLLGTFLASRAGGSSTIADFMGLDSDQGPMGPPRLQRAKILYANTLCSFRRGKPS